MSISKGNLFYHPSQWLWFILVQGVRNQMKYEKSVKRQISSQEVRSQSRQNNAKRHKRRHKKNYILHYIIIIFLLIIVLVTMSFTVLFNIKSFNVSQNTILKNEEVIKASGVTVGKNLLRINTSEIEKKILYHSIFLDTVEVKRKFPSTLDINLQFAKATYGVYYGGLYYFFSGKGRVIEISEKNTHTDIVTFWGIDLNKIKLGEYIKPSEENKNELEIAMTLKKAIDDSEIEKIQAVDLRDIANIKLYYGTEIEVIFGNLSDVDYKLKMAKKIIDTQITYGETVILDVQISGKAYLRPTESIKYPTQRN